jgi:elongation factor P--(R)-beta-lysine ligase
MYQRAALLKTIRCFMDERNIMEVETPILSPTGNTDPNIASLTTCLHSIEQKESIQLFMNTSPEFAMKRLLASGSGCIYQIAKVFRDEETGRYHEPEFTMLEWYRIGFDHHALMDETEILLRQLGYIECERKSFEEVFEKYTGLNPHLADTRELGEKAVLSGLQGTGFDRRTLLDFLFSHWVAPTLIGNRPIFIYDYPVCQAALAQIRRDSPPVAERFELFINGLEIANGFHELCDANEQLSRFQYENTMRKVQGLDEIPIDKKLIAALENGLPDCAGIAVGLDRLLIHLSGVDLISKVMTFSRDNY